MKVQKIYFAFLLVGNFLLSSISLQAQQTTIGLSFRPDYEWNFDSFVSSAQFQGGLSYSYGLQFQHDFVDSRLGFRVGLFSINRKAILSREIITVNSSTSQFTVRNLWLKSIYLSFPIELVVRVRPKIELGVGLSMQHYFYSAIYVDDEINTFNAQNDSSLHVGMIGSFNWVLLDKKWFDIKLGAVSIWAFSNTSFTAGLQLSSNFKFP